MVPILIYVVLWGLLLDTQQEPKVSKSLMEKANVLSYSENVAFT